jgi:hypothetical protein
MLKAVPFLMTALVLASPAALAQKPPVDTTVVASSAPGKAAIARMSEVTATVVAIDKATRTVTLKGPKGKTKDIVAGDEVKNFDQITVGDSVVVKYMEALSLELSKAKVSGDLKEKAAAARAKPGERPAGAVGREISALAEVVAVNPKASTISLKGPRGNTVELNVQNPEQFKVVKVGDKVEVVYTEALAMAVTPAPQAAPKK